jgi:protein-S-isoprenylcysteine O-methyltransferase Ste14
MNDLITDGILGHVRHPMYFGVLLIYLACIFLSISLISIAVWIIIIVIYDRLATFEEKQLEELFGQKYLDYKEKVPKWIPR